MTDLSKPILLGGIAAILFFVILCATSTFAALGFYISYSYYSAKTPQPQPALPTLFPASTKAPLPGVTPTPFSTEIKTSPVFKTSSEQNTLLHFFCFTQASRSTPVASSFWQTSASDNSRHIGLA